MSESFVTKLAGWKGFSSQKLSLFVAIFLLIADQLSKLCVVKYFSNSVDEVLKIFSFFNIIFVQNTGITFGIFSQKASPIFLIVLALLITVVFIFFTRKKLASTETKHYIFPCYMIVFGAIGNIIDRIYYGSVVDFLDFHLLGYHWPAFNIADSAIVVGVGIFMIFSLLEEKCDRNNTIQNSQNSRKYDEKN